MNLIYVLVGKKICMHACLDKTSIFIIYEYHNFRLKTYSYLNGSKLPKHNLMVYMLCNAYLHQLKEVYTKSFKCPIFYFIFLFFVV